MTIADHRRKAWYAAAHIAFMARGVDMAERLSEGLIEWAVHGGSLTGRWAYVYSTSSH